MRSGRIDAVEAGHVDVHDDDVGHEAQRDLDGLLSRFGLAHHLGIGDRIEKRSEPCPKQRMVVGDEDPDRSGDQAVASTSCRGRDAVTSVPPPALEPISHAPPISAARSFIV